jgi:hypothetical protein
MDPIQWKEEYGVGVLGSGAQPASAKRNYHCGIA